MLVLCIYLVDGWSAGAAIDWPLRFLVFETADTRPVQPFQNDMMTSIRRINMFDRRLRMPCADSRVAAIRASSSEQSTLLMMTNSSFGSPF